MSNKLNVKVDCHIDKINIDNLRGKLRSYNLGKDFNFAVVVLKLLITNSEKETTTNVVNANLILKVQYITPFISKQLAEEYCKELALLDKITMFLPIDENGKVVVKDYNIEETKNNISGKAMEIDKNLPAKKYLFFLADIWRKSDENEKEDIVNIFGGVRCQEGVKELLNNLNSGYYLTK